LFDEMELVLCVVSTHTGIRTRMAPHKDEEPRSAALSFRVTPTLKARLERLAKADRRDLSNYLGLVLEMHADAKLKKLDEYLEAKKLEGRKRQ
jgi:predicted DNA-binding protein